MNIIISQQDYRLPFPLRSRDVKKIEYLEGRYWVLLPDRTELQIKERTFELPEMPEYFIDNGIRIYHKNWFERLRK